tara:strand:+ start:57 stop:314 length:258 start_codon:yes stop_codon:yes gene_type:complete
MYKKTMDMTGVVHSDTYYVFNSPYGVFITDTDTPRHTINFSMTGAHKMTAENCALFKEFKTYRDAWNFASTLRLLFGQRKFDTHC